MENRRTIELKTGWWGYALTMFIVLVRALRPGAMPMEEWTGARWAIMLTPILFPWYLYLACWAVYAGGMSLVWILRRIAAAWGWITGKGFKGRV